LAGKQIKWKKKEVEHIKRVVLTVFSVLCVAVAAFLVPGGLMDILFGNEIVAQVEATPYVAFSNGELFEDSEEILFTAEQLLEEQLEGAQYRSQLHFNALSEKEQIVYRAFEYAMEKGYTNVLLDGQLVEDREAAEKVLRDLSWDSPLLEQNLSFGGGTFTMYHSVPVVWIFSRSAQLKGVYLSVKNFTADLWEKKQSALQEARTVVAALPEGLSQMEKAEHLFRHVADTITYADYPDSEMDVVYSYLYDGLVEGKTHCDGYTNSLALLLRLAGIENAEKNFLSEEKGVEGHTWNCMEIDGVWYNLDAVSESAIPERGSVMGAGFRFAFSDELLEYTASNREVFPPCTENYCVPVDATLPSSDASGLADAVVRGYSRHGWRWALVIIAEYDKTATERQMQKVANRLQETVYWRSTSLHDGRTALLVHDNILE